LGSWSIEAGHFRQENVGIGNANESQLGTITLIQSKDEVNVTQWLCNQCCNSILPSKFTNIHFTHSCVAC